MFSVSRYTGYNSRASLIHSIHGNASRSEKYSSCKWWTQETHLFPVSLAALIVGRVYRERERDHFVCFTVTLYREDNWSARSSSFFRLNTLYEWRYPFFVSPFSRQLWKSVTVEALSSSHSVYHTSAVIWVIEWLQVSPSLCNIVPRWHMFSFLPLRGTFFCKVAHFYLISTLPLSLIAFPAFIITSASVCRESSLMRHSFSMEQEGARRGRGRGRERWNWQRFSETRWEMKRVADRTINCGYCGWYSFSFRSLQLRVSSHLSLCMCVRVCAESSRCYYWYLLLSTGTLIAWTHREDRERGRKVNSSHTEKQIDRCKFVWSSQWPHSLHLYFIRLLSPVLLFAQSTALERSWYATCQ